MKFTRRKNNADRPQPTTRQTARLLTPVIAIAAALGLGTQRMCGTVRAGRQQR
jgi:hypothetical protein